MPDWDAIFSILARDAGALPSVSAIARARPGPFPVLVSTIISLRTKDAVTLEASERLLAKAGNPEALAALDAEKIARLIYPAGFYRTKAANLRRIAAILIAEHGGAVPRSREALEALPGVGPKTSALVLAEGFGEKAICVDTHVHRIANRVGWVATKRAEETERELAAILPDAHWNEINALLVSWGQRYCLPVSPRCSACALHAHCERAGVGRSR
jgi:endonuclease-3